METRLATLNDAPILAALHAASFTDGVWSLRQITDSLVLPTISPWVVFDGSDALGFLMMQRAGGEAEILTFCTVPRARCKGVGSLLLQTALASAQTANNTKIFLEVAADNTLAQKLYEKHGFAVVGKRNGYYPRGNKTIDALILALIL